MNLEGNKALVNVNALRNYWKVLESPCKRATLSILSSECPDEMQGFTYHTFKVHLKRMLVTAVSQCISDRNGKEPITRKRA